MLGFRKYLKVQIMLVLLCMCTSGYNLNDIKIPSVVGLGNRTLPSVE